ncbi:MAG: hypothetical protein EBR82_77865 [Caulobacteraceae bacterium]|nr:hypothetical protein [Caulobacteraceae bacterium]
MAAPVTSAATFSAGGGGITYASNIFGEWVQVHDNVSNTAIGASVLLNPGSYSSVDIHPLIINVGTKIRLITKFDDAVTTITTSPVVRVLGANQVPDTSGVYPTGTIFWRLDAATFNAAGTTVSSLAGSPQAIQSTGLSITTPTSNDGYELRGAKAVLVLVQTDSSFVTLNPAAAEFPIVAQVL